MLKAMRPDQQLSIAVFFLIFVSVKSNLVNRSFKCDNGTDVPVTSLCDGVRDCLDGSDENYTGRGFKCRIKKNKRNCVIPQSMIIDDVVDCDDSLDLCFDENQNLMTQQCFQCMDGGHVVSVTQVCDGIIDCEDLSDECLCMNNGNPRSSFKINPICQQVCHVTPESIKRNVLHTCGRCEVGEIVCSSATNGASTSGEVTSLFNSTQESRCVTSSDVCDGIIDCPNGDDEMYCPKNAKCSDNEAEATGCDGIPTCGDFSDECDNSCWLNYKYCDNIYNNNFYCDVSSNSNMTSKQLVSNQICDNVINCPASESDESHCSTSTHFYCWSGSTLFVNWSMRYDEVSDCVDGSDECSGTFTYTLSSPFANRNELIRNPVLQTLVWVVAVLALCGNTVVIISTAQELWKDREAGRLGRLAKCNRTFVLNLAFSDLLMGIYLLMLGIQGATKSSNYCASERTWRTSRFCILMGIITQVSSQTSLFILILMTSYRLYGTLRPFRVEESKLLGGATTATVIFWALSLVLALLPQSRFASNYFIVQYWIPLPFLNHDLLDRLDMEKLVINIYSLTNNTSRIALNDLQWRTMISYTDESNITVSHPSWIKNRVVPIGYYNHYPMCQPFFYPNVGDTAWVYMTSIVAFNFLSFAYIAIAYVVIYRASSRPCVRKSVRRRTKQWRRDNRKMQKKIFCLVFTDMACWLPICFIMMLKLSGVILHPIVHGITGTILLPINSAVNPIIYSSLLTNFKNIFKKKRSSYRNNFSSDTSDAARAIYTRHNLSMETNMMASNGSLGTLLSDKSPSNRNHVTNNNKQKNILLKSAMIKKHRHIRFSYTSSKESLNVDHPTHKPSGDHVTTQISIEPMTSLAATTAEEIVGMNIKESTL